MCDVYNKEATGTISIVGATRTISRIGATRTTSRIEGKVDREKLLDTFCLE